MKRVEMVFISLGIVVHIVASVIALAVIAWFLKPFEWTYCCTEELTIEGVTFQTGNATISVKNVGVSASSISSVKVDNVTKTILVTGGDFTGSGLEPGERGTITIGLSWTSGNRYTFVVTTTEGWKFTYRATAP